MSQQRKELKLTSDRRTWKRTWLRRQLSCPICGPNTGCNRRRKPADHSWKASRKKQYKNG